MPVAGCQGRALGTTNCRGTWRTHLSAPARGLHSDTKPHPCSRLGSCSGRCPRQGCGGDGVAVHLGRGNSPMIYQGNENPDGAGAWHCWVPSQHCAGGCKSGLVPHGCIMVTRYTPGQQQLLCKDCLCRFGRRCLHPTGASAHGQAELAKATAAVYPWWACLPAALPEPGPGTHACWKQLHSPPPGLSLGPAPERHVVPATSSPAGDYL